MHCSYVKSPEFLLLLATYLSFDSRLFWAAYVVRARSQSEIVQVWFELTLTGHG